MRISLECQKLKRTGFLPAFLGGGILAAAVPVINMSARSELYLSMDLSPIPILLNANWQMMTMFNILLVLAGTCLMYHIEFADHAMQKMKSLPIRESSIFFHKVVLVMVMSAVVLLLEAGAVAFCTDHWFEITEGFWLELFQNFAYEFLLILPSMVLSMFLASVFENMWVSLGIGVFCVFTATMLPTDHFLLSLFPFAIPFQILAGTDKTEVIHYLYAAIIDVLVLSLLEVLFVKVRRLFE